MLSFQKTIRQKQQQQPQQVTVQGAPHQSISPDQDRSEVSDEIDDETYGWRSNETDTSDATSELEVQAQEEHTFSNINSQSITTINSEEQTFTDSNEDSDDDAAERPFVCNPTFPSRAKRRTPIIVFSSSTTQSEDNGAHLLFHWIRQLLVSPPSTSQHHDQAARVQHKEQHEAHYLDLQNLFATQQQLDDNKNNDDASHRTNSDENVPNNTTVPHTPNANAPDRIIHDPIHHLSLQDSIISSEQAGYVWELALALAQNCRDTDLSNNLHELLDRHYNALRLFARNTQETMQFLQDQADQPRPHLQNLLHVMEDRHGSVAATMAYISDIPLAPLENVPQQSFWGVHFRDALLRTLELSPNELLASLMEEFGMHRSNNHDGDDSKEEPNSMNVIVVWRRNMLQSFVQKELALSSQQQQSQPEEEQADGDAHRTSGTHVYHRPSAMNEAKDSVWDMSSWTPWKTSDDHHHRRRRRILLRGGGGQTPLTVDVTRFKAFVTQQMQYYTELRAALTQWKIHFTVFEYERDLTNTIDMRTRTKKKNPNSNPLLTSVQRLQRALQLTHSDIRHARAIVESQQQKQHHDSSLVVVSPSMIANAAELQEELGFDPFESANWPDLFADIS